MLEKNDLKLKIVLILFFITVILICFAPLNCRGDSGESISVFTPVEGSIYRFGDSLIIRWQHPLGEDSVVDVYIYKGYSKVKTLLFDYRRCSYKWEINGIFDESDDYKIKVVDSSNPSIYGYSDHFTIVDEDGFTVLEPSSGNIWIKGNVKEIKWDSEGLVSRVNIYLYEQDFQRMEIAQNIYNTGSYNWKINLSLQSSKSYRIKIEDFSDSSTFDFSDNFEIKVSHEKDDNDEQNDGGGTSPSDNSGTSEDISSTSVDVKILLVIAFISGALIIGISLVGKTICDKS